MNKMHNSFTCTAGIARCRTSFSYASVPFFHCMPSLGAEAERLGCQAHHVMDMWRMGTIAIAEEAECFRLVECAPVLCFLTQCLKDYSGISGKDWHNLITGPAAKLELQGLCAYQAIGHLQELAAQCAELLAW